MEERFISLLYPSEESAIYHQQRENLPDISDRVIEELGLYEILDLRSCSLSDLVTASPEVIRYRQDVIKDVLAVPEVEGTLSSITPKLDDIFELRKVRDDNASSADEYLYSITEIELYVACISELKDGLLPVRDKIKSVALIALCDFVKELTESEHYTELTAKLNELSHRVREVKSITVGVNLDAQLRPAKAGVISVNSECFKSGKMLDKILRLSFKNDAFTTIADLSAFGKGQSENKQEALNGAFAQAIEDVFRSSIKGWRNIVGQYVIDSTDFLLRMLPEIEFVSKSTSLIKKLNAKVPFGTAFPTTLECEKKAFYAKDLYNPRVALAIDDEIVANDFEFDDKARIYVLTGPNRGGKSVITVALGAAQVLFQLGLPVPAKEAEISVSDGIFTHFPEGADDTIDKGRLGEECARLKEIFDAVTKDSLILLDESLSSTGAYEAAYIASELLSAFASVGCRGIFSTHLHELAQNIGEINKKSADMGGVMIDTLVAGIEEGKRSFKIVRMAPDGKSYARDIANKYGLSYDELIKKHKN